jgi:putative transcriptional regulator
MKSLAGSFLVAQPLLGDPNFKQTVVLILAHDGAGAYGVVVNRRVPDMELPVFRGGPCQSPGLVMLHGEQDWVNEETPEVAAGIFVGDADCLNRAREAEAPHRFRLFTGYAGWGPGQLEGELSAGAWAIVSATASLLFEVPPEDLWTELRPPRIPQPSVN